MDRCSAFKVTFSTFYPLPLIPSSNVFSPLALKTKCNSAITTTPPNTYFYTLYYFLFLFLEIIVDISRLRHQTHFFIFCLVLILNNCHNFNPHCHADNPQICSPDLSPELLPLIFVCLPLETPA